MILADFGGLFVKNSRGQGLRGPSFHLSHPFSRVFQFLLELESVSYLNSGGTGGGGFEEYTEVFYQVFGPLPPTKRVFENLAQHTHCTGVSSTTTLCSTTGTVRSHTQSSQ